MMLDAAVQIAPFCPDSLSRHDECGMGDVHGDARCLFASPLVEIHDVHCRAEARSECCLEHVETRHEVQVTRRGAFSRDVCGSVTMVHSGLATFANPGDAIRIAHPLPGGDVRSAFRLSTDGARALLGGSDNGGRDDQSSHVPRFTRADTVITGPSFLAHQLAVRAALHGPTDALGRLIVEERSMAFLSGIMGSVPRRGSGPHALASREARNRYAREYVMRVREVIARHYQEPLSLSRVADLVGCSPYHLTRIITAHEGVPVYRLIIRHRLRHALERVLGSRDSLSRIALETGFASQSHFGDAFRREFGCAPGRARRMGQTPRVSPHATRHHGDDIAASSGIT